MAHTLEQFRLDLYEVFPYRRDTLLDLLDALSSNSSARSVVELSLSPFFRREYSSITDGIDQFFFKTQHQRKKVMNGASGSKSWSELWPPICLSRKHASSGFLG